MGNPRPYPGRWDFDVTPELRQRIAAVKSENIFGPIVDKAIVVFRFIGPEDADSSSLIGRYPDFIRIYSWREVKPIR